MSYHQVSHDEYLQRVCGVCFTNRKDRNKISPVILEDIREFHYSDYNLQSDVLPRVICGSCRKNLVRKKLVRIILLTYTCRNLTPGQFQVLTILK